MIRTSLDGAIIADIAGRLSIVDAERRRRYPGDVAGRQPVHTCYVPADRVTGDVAAEWGEAARAAFAEHAARLRAEGALPPPRKTKRARR